MKKAKTIPLLILFIFVGKVIFAQKIMSYQDMQKPENKNKGVVVAADINGKDTALYVNLRPIYVFPPRVFKNKREKRRYTRLMMKVIKVYPYSVTINNIFTETQWALDSIKTKKEKRKMLKQKEKELKAKFEKTIRNMTFSEGRILIKLVDRQTGHTSYELVQQLKGNVSAILWQSVARVFSTNLKYEYDKEGEDKWIEEIVAKIENGQL